MFNWSDIDTILLDMDGTLLDLSFDNYFWLHHLPKQYAQRKNLDLENTRANLQEMSNSLKGSLNWYCVDHWSEVLDIDIESLKAEISHRIQFRPHTPEFLTFLRDMDKQLILVTNAHPKSLKLKTRTSGLDQHLDKMISSHDYGLAKENQGFWHEFAHREQIDLSRCLFIDDSIAVLDRASEEGVKHILQILQPDSGQPAVDRTNFPGIVHFNELMLVQDGKG